MTPREWQVLQLLSESLTNDGIAERLGISLSGVKYHVGEILSKLGVSSREEAVARMRQEKRLSAVPLLLLLRKTPFIAGLVTAIAILGVTMYIWGPSLSTSLPRPEIDQAVGFDGGDIEAGAAAFTALAGHVSRDVVAVYPDAVLKQVDLDGTGSRSEFRFVTAMATCTSDFPSANDPVIRRYYADKCDVLVTFPGMQWEVRAPWQGDIGSAAVDPSVVQVGPDTVVQLAVNNLAGCTPRSLTLAATQPSAWYVFCSLPDGLTISATVDARTGSFQSSGVPVAPPPTAPATQ